MHLSKEVTLAASPEAVAQIMQSEDFQRAKADRVGAIRFVFSRHVSGGLLEVVTRRTVPTAGLPEFVRSMVKATMTAVETERWQLDGPSNPRAEFDVDVEGAPVILRGQVEAAPVGDEVTRLSFSGNVSSTVPLFKEQVAKAGSGAIVKTIEAEFQLLKEWIAEGRIPEAHTH